MHAQIALAEAVRSTIALVERYLKGFDDSNHTRQAAGLPNHVAWSLGHLALTMHRVAAMVDGGPLPAAEFTDGKTGTGGADGRFGAESVAFGSTPSGDASHYPSMMRCIAIFRGAVERLARACEGASDEQLGREFPWGQAKLPWRVLVSRMIYHNGMHTGQIADLRRAFGMPSVFS